jgi:hypothetical protein
LIGGKIEAKLFPSWFNGVKNDQGGAAPLEHHALVRRVDRPGAFEVRDRALDCQGVFRGVPAHEHHAIRANCGGRHGRLVSQDDPLSVTDFDPVDGLRDGTGTVVVAVLQAAP